MDAIPEPSAARASAPIPASGPAAGGDGGGAAEGLRSQPRPRPGWAARPGAQIGAGVLCLLAASGWIFGLQALGPVVRGPSATWATAILIGALGLGMTLWDLAFRQSWRDNLQPRARLGEPTRQRIGRVLRKWLGLHTVLAVLGLVYATLAEYRSDLYQPFFEVVRTLGLAFSIASLPYIAWVDARMAEPEDVYAWLGGSLVSRRTHSPTRAQWQAFVLGWLVKGFFLPLMFGYAARQVVALDQLLHAPAAAAGLVPQFRVVFEAVFVTCYFVDVVWGATGYLWSLRLTDSHIRSAEPTAQGWVAALICYEPFSKGLWPAYFAYGSSKAWGYWMGDMPWAYVAWGSLILLLLGVYTASTMAFGLRFSNLTHRGIITHGPYRWMRHPAYVSKNLSWWLIGMPFMVDGSWVESLRLCAMLLAVNALYLWRARTEERHLGADPAYQAYCADVAARQARWLARIGRLLRPGGRRGAAPGAGGQQAGGPGDLPGSGSGSRPGTLPGPIVGPGPMPGVVPAQIAAPVVHRLEAARAALEPVRPPTA